MTTPASALSFHCMICFEEFHHAERYPVVLPCGHTYVCHVCAERLDKCMECRTLLTWSIPNPNAPRPKSPRAANSPPRWSSRTSGRSTPSNTPAKPAMVMEKKRLPLPKNVVLLSLIEAKELASEMAETTTKIDSLLGNDAEIDDNVYDEEEKIKVSTTLTIGACGTYVVAEKEGLEVYPSRPAATTEPDNISEEKDMPSEEDVNSLVRFFHLDHKLEVCDSEDNLKKAYSEESAPVELHYGDRVQVVSFDDGWAKLARGYGYARAYARQLVKVGGSVDRACRLEAYLHALAARRRELKAEGSKVDTRFTELMNNLQASLFNDEDLTVIPADTYKDDDGSHVVIPQAEQAAIGQSFSEDSGLTKPYAVVRQPTPPSLESGLSCNMRSVFQVMSATLGGDDDPPPLPQVASAPAATGEGNFSTEVAQAPTQAQEQSSAQAQEQARRSSSPQRTRELSAEAEAWRERYYQQQMERKPMDIDFRTGLSGHQGLVSYMVHPHEYLNSQQRALPKMSSHSGLSRSNRSTKSSWQQAPSYSYSRDGPS